MGSVKTNIGHLEVAAGVAGVIKVLLQLKHATLAKSLHCEEINPYIQLDGSPFYIVRETRPWLALRGPSGAELPRRAGVSSFGFGGANAHLVIEEYVAPVSARAPAAEIAPSRPALIVLSARNGEQLRGQVRKLRAHVEAHEPSDAALAALAYTLQVGREAMEHRLAFTAASVAELRQKLAALESHSAAGEIRECYAGQVKREPGIASLITADEELQAIVSTWWDRAKYTQVLELWTDGVELDWARFYGDGKPRRMSLPTYPFEKGHYWLELQTPAAPVHGRSLVPAGPSLLHPLLHRNTSVLDAQRFTSRLTGEEFYLTDHIVRGAKILPGVCYLEMARAAVAYSTVGFDASARLVMTNVTWLQPMAVTNPRDLHVFLDRDALGRIRFEIRSASDELRVDAGQHAEPAEEGAVYALGQVEPMAASSTAGLDPAADAHADAHANGPIDFDAHADLGALSASCDWTWDAEACYAAFASLGLEYGPAHRGLRRVRGGCDADGREFVLAEVVLPAAESRTEEQLVLHPSSLDGALQACVAFALHRRGEGKPEANGRELALPFALDRLEILDRTPERGFAWVRRSADSGAREVDENPKLDVSLYDDVGRACVRVSGLSSRKLADDGAEEREVLLLAPHWQRRDIPAIAPPSAERCEHIVLLDTRFRDRLDALKIRLAGRELETVRLSVAGPDERATELALQMFQRLQSLARRSSRAPILLQLVLCTDELREEMNLAVSGLFRSVRQEHPQL
ncbi:MAG: polyketide synthase dehydratase domain-containing protein, partial [Steroidobacteraceae bacterium]